MIYISTYDILNLEKVIEIDQEIISIPSGDLWFINNSVVLYIEKKNAARALVQGTRGDNKKKTIYI